MIRQPQISTLFPYTTLFRSKVGLNGFVVTKRQPRRIGPIGGRHPAVVRLDRKSTRLNSSHMSISYAVFCLKKKKSCCVANVIEIILIESCWTLFLMYYLIIR